MVTTIVKIIKYAFILKPVVNAVHASTPLLNVWSVTLLSALHV